MFLFFYRTKPDKLLLNKCAYNTGQGEWEWGISFKARFFSPPSISILLSPQTCIIMPFCNGNHAPIFAFLLIVLHLALAFIFLVFFLYLCNSSKCAFFLSLHCRKRATNNDVTRLSDVVIKFARKNHMISYLL